MNYFLNTWAGALSFAQVTIAFIILFFFVFLTAKLIQAFNLPEGLQYSILFVTAGALVALSLLGINMFRHHFNDGKIMELYIIDPDGDPSLAVLFMRDNAKGRGTSNATHRLKSFDLLTGKFFGREDLVRKDSFFEYRIYGPFGNKAWGIYKKDLQLVDMAKPAIIAEGKEILEKNPQLGNKIRLVFVDNVYDPVKHTIQVKDPQGKHFRIRSDLKAVPTEPYSKPYYPIPRYWIFSWAPGTEGKNIHYRSSSLAPQAERAVLLHPELVRELNKKAAAKKRVWVEHRSTLFGKYDLLLSYIDANGRESNQINLRQMFDDPKTRALATFSRDKETLVFVTRQEYSLTALRTDPATGKILGRIDYF